MKLRRLASRSRFPHVRIETLSRAAAVEQLESRLLLARLLGIDVSHYQGTINWPVVAQYKDFAFIRATTGISTFDTRFTANATQAVANGLYVGFYHYAYYDLAGHTAINEADHFWGVIKPYMLNDGKHLMPVLDLERNSPPSDGSTVDQWANVFCQRIQSRALSELGLSVTPMIYTGASKAGTLFSDGSVPLNYPLWVAQWPNPIPDPQTAQPSGDGDWQNGTSPSFYSSWSFWQYAGDPANAPKGSSPGVSGVCDLDVFQGDEHALKTYIIGSPGRWNAGTRVQVNYLLKAWNTPFANGSSVNVPAGTKGTIVHNTTYNKTHHYGNSFWRWYVQFDNGTSGWVAEYQTVTSTSPFTPIDWLTTVSPSAPTGPAPSNSTATWLTSLPGTFTWAAGANATSYDVYVDGVKKTNVAATSWTHAAIADGSHTWRVDSVNGNLTATGTTWNFKVDTAAPTATFGGQSPAHGASSLLFTVTYGDGASGVQFASIGTGDVEVTGPNGFSQVGALVSVDAGTDGTPRVATYSITAPGGMWDNADIGTYTISQAAGQVRDVAGHFRAAGAVGTFVVGFSPAYLSGTTLVVTYPAPGTMRISRSGANIVVYDGFTNYSLPAADIAAISVNTTAGNDMLELFGAIPAAISVAGTGGSDAIVLNSFAAATFATNVPGFAMTIGLGATVTADVPLHLSSLAINGGWFSLPAGSGAALVVRDLSVTGGGMLDLADNPLIWDYEGATPIDTLRALLRNGRDGGSWEGSDGISSSIAAVDPAQVAALGYLEASDLGVTRFAGVDVDATSLLVKYTSAGDVNLDGVVDGDDLMLADLGFARQVANARWINGDFDYDGALTPVDRLLIHQSYQSQSGGAAAADAAVFSAMPIVAEDPVRIVQRPVAVATAPKAVKRGKAVTFKLSTHGSLATRFTYRIDWNGDGVVDKVIKGRPDAITVAHKFARTGKQNVTVWAVDELSGLSSKARRLTLKVL